MKTVCAFFKNKGNEGNKISEHITLNNRIKMDIRSHIRCQCSKKKKVIENAHYGANAHLFYQSTEQSTDKKAIIALDCPSSVPHTSSVRSRFVLLQDW